jgi:hypothetical protein
MNSIDAIVERDRARDVDRYWADEQTPTPLEPSPVMDFLSCQDTFQDDCGDALLFPGEGAREWSRGNNAIRCKLFAIQEARDNGMSDRDACADLATLLLKNISKHVGSSK